MGAQQAIFAADTAELEPLELTADLERPAPLCQLVAEDSGECPEVSPSIEISDDAIRQRSQQIWEREGRLEGYAQDHWERARAELAALMARTTNAHLAPPPVREEDVVPTPALEDDMVPPCPEEAVVAPLTADIAVPEASPSADAADDVLHDDDSGDVLDDDGAREPEVRQDLTVSRPPDEIISAASRPMRAMPARRSQQSGVVPSIICAGLVFRGTLESSGDIQFDGAMEGDICCSSLAIGDDAFVQGDIVADEVFVRGRIQGCIRARRVYLACGAYVEGVIHYGTLAVEGGAQIDGSFQRQDELLALEYVCDTADTLPVLQALSTAAAEADAA